MASSEFAEQLINQLVTSESSMDQTIGSVFKSVFSEGRHTEFLKASECYSRKKDVEIERLCNQHFDIFIQSIDELLAMRTQAIQLKNVIARVQKELGSSGQLLYDSGVEIFETKKMIDGTEKVILAMQYCLAALNTTQQITLEISDGNFGHSLRLIEVLQSELLPRIEQFPSVTEKIERLVPTQFASIRSFAVEGMKSWLDVARERTSSIGELAFAMAQKRIERWRGIYEGLSTPTTSSNGLLHSGEDSASAYVDLVEMEREDADNILKHEITSINFVPLLKALHLFELMNQRHEFQNLFAEYRRAQAKVIFELPVNLRDPEARSFANFLHTVCGFFIVEYFLAQHPQSFYSPIHVEDLWESVVIHINSYVMESLNVGSGVEAIIMKIKWLQVFFFHSVEVTVHLMLYLYGAYTSHRFVDLSKVDLSQKIHQALNRSNLQPMPISPANSILRIRKLLPFVDRDPRADEYATEYPFSSFIPDLMTLLTDFIANFYNFLEGIPQQTTEVDALSRKTCDWLLREASDALAAKSQSAAVEGAVQIVCDFDALKLLADDINDILSSKRK